MGWRDERTCRSKDILGPVFAVFGVNRRRVAVFERPVKKHDGHGGYIDLLWKGTLLVEHKSKGKNLDRAKGQAFDYFEGLADDDLPRFVVVSDFANIRLYDLDSEETHDFPLEDLPKKIGLFGFMSGYEKKVYAEEDPVNIKAAERLGKLHDLLEKSKYQGHELEVFMVRILFCLFADDTEIFERGAFRDYIERRTTEDGFDLGLHLGKLFEVLDQPPEDRQTTLDEQLAAFQYVNGDLFKEKVSLPCFNRAMRQALIEASRLDWSRISPAIFGSLFQSIMDKDMRRNLGAHYTTEANILKALNPLFLDDLKTEFESIKTNRRRLNEFHDKLANIRILDPACGCGNFLVVAYRELRRIELDVLRAIHGSQVALEFKASVYIKLDVDQFYGIEIGEWPAQIARVAMWLVDHQMNMDVAAEFGVPFFRLPLKKSAHIYNENALQCDWANIIAPTSLSYIVGNPPFSGSKKMSTKQRADMATVFTGIRSYGSLDYVSAWYWKAAQFIKSNSKIEVAYVSTNSIVQGEQPDILWKELLNLGVRINFAHRTFEWTSESSGKAGVHCIIVGFSLFDRKSKEIFDYDPSHTELYVIKAKNINPYLVDGPDITLPNRSQPICRSPKFGIGNKPIDGGWYLFTPEEKDEFLKREPGAATFFRKWLGSEEFINGVERWILWLGDADPSVIRHLPLVQDRIQKVRLFRKGEAIGKNGRRAKDKGTAELAATPTRFHVENIPTKPYLIIPRHSGENRIYIPIESAQADTFCGDANLMSRDATVYDFGILTSMMHMAWVRAVCGRLESRYRYSVGVVYNNFPWPNPSAAQRKKIEDCAQHILDVRAQFPKATLADLYNPNLTPSKLAKAHIALDACVDAAYGKTKFKAESERVAFLLELYQGIESPLLPTPKRRATGRRRIA